MPALFQFHFRRGTPRPMLRVDTVKLLADGGLSGATAALSIPYRHADTRGTLRFETSELRSLARNRTTRDGRLPRTPSAMWPSIRF